MTFSREAWRISFVNLSLLSARSAEKKNFAFDSSEKCFPREARRKKFFEFDSSGKKFVYLKSGFPNP